MPSSLCYRPRNHSSNFMIESVLIANRGEIACRIIATLRRMGIRSIAVYHFSDRRSPHVQLADVALELEAQTPTAAYLDMTQIVRAAKRSSATALHPGYGFLAENADFARMVTDQGLIFIGPSPDVIEVMGDKIRATDFAAAAGIPVPQRAINDDITILMDEVDVIGYPVLIKAAAGGGGKGMKIVQSREQLRGQLTTAQSEAERYFLDRRVYVEKLINRPRHIEVQILGDGNGDVVHLFERECSIQRRFQKIIEESPAPNLDQSVRDKMCEAAVTLSTAAKYRGAGTVEFILAPNNSFYFLEMNTRLQVEHPVTEQVTGFDLVEEQIYIANYKKLRFDQTAVTQNGHAIECRICAEEPNNDFLPATGVVRLLRLPTGTGVRVDNGVNEGQEISAAFDSMLAKLIVHGPDRLQTIESCINALHNYILLGVTANIDYLTRILRHSKFRSGNFDTGFVTESATELKANALEGPDIDAVLLAAALTDASFHQSVLDVPDLHAAIGRWRN